MGPAPAVTATGAQAVVMVDAEDRPTGGERGLGLAVRKWLQRPVTDLLPPVVLLLLMALYVYHFSTISVAMLRAYDQPAYDMAIPDQGIWLLSHFHAPFLTVAGRNLFGDHTCFVYLLLVPLYWVYPHPAALLVVQAVLQAGAAVPVYLLARHLLEHRWAPLLLAGAYLVDPIIQQTALEQFHVEAFEVFFLAWAIYAAVRWRPRMFVVFLVLVLMCKEDAALYTAPLAAWALWRRDRRVGALGLALSALSAGFDNLVLVPALIGYTSAHGGRIPFGGFGGAFSTLVRRPGRFFSYLVSNGRLFYLWQVMASGGLAFLVAPEIAVVCVLQLVVNIVSDVGYQHQIVYHYSMPLAGVLACASVYAVARASRPALRRAGVALVVVSSLWSGIVWGAAPFSDHKATPPDYNSAPLVADRRLIKMIPPGAVVSADQQFVVALDHRQQIYMWPNPFYQVYYGNPKNDGKRWPQAAKVQWLLLPTCIACDEGTAPWAKVERRVVRQFHAVANDGHYVLYRRTPAHAQ